MSISTRDKNDPSDDGEGNNKKKYVKMWRIEASKEFLMVMGVIIFAIATSMYNPLKLQEIAYQNQGYNKENLNNTNRIIEYLDVIEENDTVGAMDLIKILLLYNQDHERDLAKILKALDVPNNHYVDINGTHIITESTAIKLPYPINIDGFVPINLTDPSYSNSTMKNNK